MDITTATAHPRIGLLLMAYGSPESLAEMEPYLLDIRNGRPVSPALLAEIKERYALIGGRSPLLEITRAQASGLEAELNRRLIDQGFQFKAYVGMRHWQPRIRETIAQMKADGIHQVVAIVMAPHSSQMSTGAYFARLDEAISELDAQIEVIRILSWHDQPGFIAALAENASSALQKFSPTIPFVIFTAHSLPARILEAGDPYDSQLRQTAHLLAERLNLSGDQWLFCYQSAGESSEVWLGPSIEQTIVNLIQAGKRDLLVVPIGFVCDHVEVLYDIDIAAKNLAAANGAHLERSASLNVHPAFISALADLVAKNLLLQVIK